MGAAPLRYRLAHPPAGSEVGYTLTWGYALTRLTLVIACVLP
jgi:hypothetical protein